MENAIKREEMDKRAEKALADVDAKELHALYKRSEKSVDDLIQAMNVMSEHYHGQTPRAAQPEAIAAMRDVALAALEIARLLVTKNDLGKKP